MPQTSAAAKRGTRAAASRMEKNKKRKTPNVAARRQRASTAMAGESGRSSSAPIKGTRLSFSSAMGSDHSESGGSVEERLTTIGGVHPTAKTTAQGNGAISGFPCAFQRSPSNSSSRISYAASLLRVVGQRSSPSLPAVPTAAAPLRDIASSANAQPVTPLPTAAAVLAGMKRDRSVDCFRPLAHDSDAESNAHAEYRSVAAGEKENGPVAFQRSVKVVTGNDEEEETRINETSCGAVGKDRARSDCALLQPTPPRMSKRARHVSPLPFSMTADARATATAAKISAVLPASTFDSRVTRGSLGLSSLRLTEGPGASFFASGLGVHTTANAAAVVRGAGADSEKPKNLAKASPPAINATTATATTMTWGNTATPTHNSNVTSATTEEEEELWGEMASQTVPRRRTPRDERAFTPDGAVQAALTQEPVTASREVQLRPGCEPPSPVTPLWAALEEARGESHANRNDGERRAVGPMTGTGTAAGRSPANEEEGGDEIDIFALDWSPLTVPRRSRGSVEASPSTAPAGQQQQQHQTSMLIAGDDDSFLNTQEDSMETEDADLRAALVSSRGTRIQPCKATANSNSSTNGAMNSMSSGRAATSARRYQTAGVSVRGSNTRRRTPSVGLGVRVASTTGNGGGTATTTLMSSRRSVNLMDPEGLLDADAEPFFPSMDSTQDADSGRGDSFDAVVAAVTRREMARGGGRTDAAPRGRQKNRMYLNEDGKDGVGDEEEEAWISLTQEAAALEGIEQGHGAQLQRGPPRGRVDGGGSSTAPMTNSARNREAAAQQQWEPLTRELAGYSWGITRADTTTTASSSSAAGSAENMKTTPTPTSSQMRQAMVASASQPTSARAQKMLNWAEQTRGFFRFIDQRQLRTANSPVISGRQPRRVGSGANSGGNGSSGVTGGDALVGADALTKRSGRGGSEVSITPVVVSARGARRRGSSSRTAATTSVPTSARRATHALPPPLISTHNATDQGQHQNQHAVTTAIISGVRISPASARGRATRDRRTPSSTSTMPSSTVTPTPTATLVSGRGPLSSRSRVGTTTSTYSSRGARVTPTTTSSTPRDHSRVSTVPASVDGPASSRGASSSSGGIVSGSFSAMIARAKQRAAAAVASTSPSFTGNSSSRQRHA